MKATALADVGRKRPQNQDTFVIDSEPGQFIICDGMGGHAAGEVASKRAVELTAEIL
jgi:PPM family protein phosphatase